MNGVGYGVKAGIVAMLACVALLASGCGKDEPKRSALAENLAQLCEQARADTEELGLPSEKGFAVMDKALAGKDYLVGAFSIADSALFYVEFWGAKRMNMTLPANCAAHLDRMLARPAVQRVMQQEGLN